MKIISGLKGKIVNCFGSLQNSKKESQALNQQSDNLPKPINKFKFSNNSLKNLEGIDGQIIELVKLAIAYSEVDFGVSEGLRTKERQKKLLDEGKTQTLKSKHLDGLAVDVFAYVEGKAVWDYRYYFPIVEAFKKAQERLRAEKYPNLEMRWGGCWKKLRFINDPERDVNQYKQFKHKKGEKPFIDAPHFEKVK